MWLCDVWLCGMWLRGMWLCDLREHERLADGLGCFWFEPPCNDLCT